MPSKPSSQSNIKTREGKTSGSSSKGSSHSSKRSSSLSKAKPEQKESSKVSSSSKLKLEKKESTKEKSKPDPITKSTISSKSAKNDVSSKSSVNISKSKSLAPSNKNSVSVSKSKPSAYSNKSSADATKSKSSTPVSKSSKISSSSGGKSEKTGSSTSKSGSGKLPLQSSGSRKHESSNRKEHRPSKENESSKSDEKRKVHNSKESREKEKVSKNAKDVAKTSSKSSSRSSSNKNSKEDTKSKKDEENIKTEKHSKSKKSDEKIEKAKKPEKLIKKENSFIKEKEKIDETKKPIVIENNKEVISKKAPEVNSSEKGEIDKAEKPIIIESDNEIMKKGSPELNTSDNHNDNSLESLESEIGEIEKIEKPIEIKDNKEIIGKDSLEVNTTVNHNDNSLETMESGISMTSPNELSDGEVEESISSRFVEVDEMEYQSPPSSSINLHSSSQPLQNDSKLDVADEKEEEKGTKEDTDMDYEEDFEDYESDFEDDVDEEDEDEDDDEDDDDDNDDEDDDEEEEDSNDSGDYDDDDDSDSDSIEVDPQMLAVLKALEAENSRPKTRASRKAQEETNYQEIDTGQETSSTRSSRSRPKTSRAYVNFNRAKERAKGEKASEKMKNRGQILLEMIQLDTISIDLFIQISDSYESYIAAFGRTNTLQTSSQTNDDAISEEVQTESLPLLNKWTQKPINISVKDEYLPTPEDFLGVGGDSVQEDDDDEFTHTSFRPLSFDSGRLTKFLSASSQVVLMLLEEDSVFNNESLVSDEDENLGFSKTGIALGSGMTSLLKGRKANFVSFCLSDPLMVVTGHSFQDPNNNATGFVSKESKNDQESEEENEDVLEIQNEETKAKEETSHVSSYENGAFLCMWSIRQPSFPQRILSCHSSPRVACFCPGRPIALVAGMTDGSLAAWDFRESLANHPVTVSFGDDKKWRLSPPSYITACHKEGFIGGSEIVAVESVGKPEELTTSFGSFQVISLSSLGQLTWWVIVQGEIQPMKITDINSTGLLTDYGAAPWSRIVISRAASLSVGDILPQSEDEFSGSNLCYDLKLSSNDPNQMYVAIANGRVLHCSRHNIKLHPSSFIPEIEPGTEAISISVCPHDPLYLLVGGNDGLIRLHSITSPSPLTCWQASNNPAPVKKVEWSPSRPCVFYMLDDLGMFHIWDLSAGDIYPIVSLEKGELVDGNLTDFNVAASSTDMNLAIHAVFASESGTVSIRSISSQFLKSSEEEYKDELERFRCYVSII